MPPSINDISIKPSVVQAGSKVKIIVDADLHVYFDTLEKMTWNDFNNRNLKWSDIDETTIV